MSVRKYCTFTGLKKQQHITWFDLITMTFYLFFFFLLQRWYGKTGISGWQMLMYLILNVCVSSETYQLFTSHGSLFAAFTVYFSLIYLPVFHTRQNRVSYVSSLTNHCHLLDWYNHTDYLLNYKTAEFLEQVHISCVSV